MGVRVRFAAREDVPALIAMGHAMHAESPRFRGVTFDGGKTTALTESMIESPDTCVIIAENEDEPVGMMLGFVMPHWFGTDLTAGDLVLYVKPEFRRVCRAAFMLVSLFEKWAQDKGAKEIAPGVSTGVDPEGTARFYEKLGYRRYGVLMLKEL